MLRLRVRIPQGHECLLLGLCVVRKRFLRGPILRLEESYRVCVCVSLSVMRWSSNPLHLQWLGRNRSDWERNKKGRKIKVDRSDGVWVEVYIVSTYSYPGTEESWWWALRWHRLTLSKSTDGVCDSVDQSRSWRAGYVDFFLIFILDGV